MCSPYAANCRWFSPFHIKSSSEKSDIEPGSFRSRRSSRKNLSLLLRTDAAVKAIRRKANSSKYTNLWPKAVLEALDDAIELNHWESALKIFSLLRKQQWYEPKCRAYTMLLLMLGRCKLPDEAGVLFDTLLSDGLRPTLDVYTALVTAYSSGGLLEKAMLIVDEMKNPPPDAFTYSPIIKSCFEHGRLGAIPSVLDRMSASGIERTGVTFNILIDGYGKARRFGAMERRLGEMIEAGICPDVYTFNSVVGAYGRCGMIGEMERRFDEFRAMGLNPDAVTCNTMIRSYGLRGMHDKMMNVREFMRKRFISPTVATYNAVIEAYGRAGNVEKMEEVFLEMKEGGLKPNKVTYTSAVKGYGRAKEKGLKGVGSVVRQVENNGDAALDTGFFNCAMEAYGNGGDLEGMMELFRGMARFGCEPDHVSFAVVRKHGVDL
ncbi:hypothetical protein M569_16151 [Genlisea aurea]|uniref:Pentacotripeptide-repeat region of PRORP domain-containing protein n=1 Tax=Genlisea aurea TaxID=192259 RepID=S8C2H4_9LAMI|nr:hypothetical protein M569_16151 [Genlisea aurea]